MTWFRLVYNDRRKFQNMSLRNKVRTKRWLKAATAVAARQLPEAAALQAAQDLFVFGAVSVEVGTL